MNRSTSFVDTSFEKDAFFDELKGKDPESSLEFFGVTFSGRAYFDDSRVANLRFSKYYQQANTVEIA